MSLELLVDLGFGKSTARRLDVACLRTRWVGLRELLSQVSSFFLISYLNCLKSLRSLKIPPDVGGLWKIGSSKIIRLYQRERNIRALPTWSLWKRRQEQLLPTDHE